MATEPVKLFVTDSRKAVQLIADLRQGKHKAIEFIIQSILNAEGLKQEDIINHILQSNNTDDSYILAEYVQDKTVQQFLIGGINALKTEQVAALDYHQNPVQKVEEQRYEDS